LERVIEDALRDFLNTENPRITRPSYEETRSKPLA
jgi:hypothetical protein